MNTIKHRFFDHPINSKTETLIIGTFNPDTKGNLAEFFYGRGRNFLWKLLPIAYGELSLKSADVQEKIAFINMKAIDFIDLIAEIEIEEGQETNYSDGYIDKKITQCCDVISEIEKLKFLKRVCFTRKTFSDIPKMKKQIEAIQAHCEKNRIYFKALTTPARFYNMEKQIEWTDFLLHD